MLTGAKLQAFLAANVRTLQADPTKLGQEVQKLAHKQQVHTHDHSSGEKLQGFVLCEDADYGRIKCPSFNDLCLER